MISFLAIKKRACQGPHNPCLFSAALAANDPFWGVTFLHKWNTLEQKSCACQSKCDSKHPPCLRQTRRCCWSPSPWLTFGIASRQTPSLSLKWQQLAAGAKRRGYFECARGQTERGRSTWGEGGTERATGAWSGKQREGRARRSGIIRSLCGPLKRLRRKPTDGPSVPRHLGKGDTRAHTHTHLKDAVVKADKQVPFGHRCILKKERWTDRKYEKLEAG